MGGVGRPLIALVPEFDDYLRPEEARERFARVPQAEVVGVDGAEHLWVGEPYGGSSWTRSCAGWLRPPPSPRGMRIVLNEIVRRVNPAAHPLPTEVSDS